MLIYFNLLLISAWWIQGLLALKVGSIQNARIKVHKREVLQDLVSNLHRNFQSRDFNLLIAHRCLGMNIQLSFVVNVS